jgi:GNAT superfamily N-acetyltransferase
MTDVLGICESWAEGRVLIRREDGSTIEIDTADIVSGKPVPPRASTRMRVSVREAEGHAAPLWPVVVREPLGDWELRTDPEPVGRLIKRANSCLAMGDPGVPFDDAARQVIAFYTSRGREALAQVEADSNLERAFADAGWQDVPGGEADSMLASLSRSRRLLDVERSDVTADRSVDGPRLEVTADLGPDRIGFVQAALDGDWLGVHGLFVEHGHRRQGIASLLMAEVLDYGAEQGATTLWLHVETDNAPARAFYERLGLVTYHTCRYLRAPRPL